MKQGPLTRRLLFQHNRKKYTSSSAAAGGGPVCSSSSNRYSVGFSTSTPSSSSCCYYSSLSEPSAVGGLPPIINETVSSTTTTKKPTAGTARFSPTTVPSTTTTPLPKRIILLRHGESLGNVDENSYSHIPDWKIPLTRRGERQSLKAATDLVKLLQSDDEESETLFAYCSPYKRTNETWEIMRDYIIQDAEEETYDETDDSNNKNREEKETKSATTTTRIELLGTREEPRIAEHQFGNFQVRNTSDSMNTSF